MKFEAITISVGEKALRFLEITLPQNIKFFDNYIVITTPEDKATIDFCSQYPVTVLKTNAFNLNGAKFNKGAAYNQAFQILDYKDQICILDCDSYINDKLGKLLNKREFETNVMYGSRRVIIPTYYDFNLLCNFGKEYENKLWIPLGICYGYFVVFNYNAESIKKHGLYYPDSYDTSNSDWQFRNFYFGDLSDDAKEYRGNLSELKEFIWHLGEPNLESGKNFFN